MVEEIFKEGLGLSMGLGVPAREPAFRIGRIEVISISFEGSALEAVVRGVLTATRATGETPNSLEVWLTNGLRVKRVPSVSVSHVAPVARGILHFTERREIMAKKKKSKGKVKSKMPC